MDCIDSFEINGAVVGITIETQESVGLDGNNAFHEILDREMIFSIGCCI